MKKNNSPTLLLLALFATVILVGLIVYWLFLNSEQTTQPTEKEKSRRSVISEAVKLQKDSMAGYQKKEITEPSLVPKVESITIENVSPEEQFLNQGISLPTEQKTNADLTEQSVKNLNDFFHYLDQQDYIQSLDLADDTKTTFSTLLIKLVNDPPVIIGESEDLFTLLKNTAHFFRVLGDSNLTLLKQIIINENDKLEILARDLFIILNDSKAMQRNFNITLQENTLYEYSCFLMNTMGGRLYMFRRDMELRMIISYYSILFVKKAEEEGLNQHGIDILPFVASLIKEIENHGQNLVMRDKYLEDLYQLEQHVNQ